MDDENGSLGAPVFVAGGFQGRTGSVWHTILVGRDPCPSKESPEFALRAFASLHPQGDGLPNYSAAASIALVCDTVQSGAPTLKRAKRRTVMFSPSLPTFCAISSLMLTAWSLMKGCSSRQTSS